MIHAFGPYRMVDESDASLGSDLTLRNDGRRREMRAFSCWGPASGQYPANDIRLKA